MTVTYRDAGAKDAEALASIFKQSFCDTFAHLYRSEDLEAFLANFTVASWERELSDENVAFRLAEIGREPVGYAKLGPMKLPLEPCGTAIVLDQLYILKEHHGTGIAHQLMDWTIDEAQRRSAAELYLTVYVDNHRAKRFYDRYGFEAVGRYDFMVGNHADEDIIMRKKL